MKLVLQTTMFGADELVATYHDETSTWSHPSAPHAKKKGKRIKVPMAKHMRRGPKGEEPTWVTGSRAFALGKS